MNDRLDKNSPWNYPGKESRPRTRRPRSNAAASARQLESAIGAPQTGDLINHRFRVQERLGRGGMSVVYRAFDQVKECGVALKFLSPALLGDPEAARSFLVEARISMQLNHRNILKVFDVQEHQDAHFLVMELLEGGTLRDWMKRSQGAAGGVPFAKACRMLAGICRALQWAHHAMVHRDLKPENIGITQTGEIKIMDFGLARVTSRQHTALFREAVTQINAGTPYYIAPEQLSGAAHGHPASDQFSVGVIAYEMFTGRLPAGLAPALTESRYDLPARLAAAIDRALSLRPEDRWPDLSELIDAFAAGENWRPSPWKRGWRRITQAAPLARGILAFGLLTVLAAYPAGIWLDSIRAKHSQLESAWNELNESSAALGELTDLIRERRQVLEFLEAKHRLQQRLPRASLEAQEDSVVATSNRLQSAQLLMSWLEPQVTSVDTFLSADRLLDQARSSLKAQDLRLFEGRVQALGEEKARLVQAVESARRAFELEQEYRHLRAGAEALQELNPSGWADALAAAERAVQNELWLEAIPAWESITAQLRAALERRFQLARDSFAESRRDWNALFGELGPPDLSFLADPDLSADQARRLYQAGDYPRAIMDLHQAAQVYEGWTAEVKGFRQRLAAWPPPPSSRLIEGLGMQFVEIDGLYWSRWEARVMDFARWIAEENKLSTESAEFWQNPGYPVGPTHPVVGISRRDAKEFSLWVGHNLTRHGRPRGRLPTRSEWEALLEGEGLKLASPFGIYPDKVQWVSDHFREHYRDLQLDPARFLGPVNGQPPSKHGLFGLTGGVWEWTASFYEYGQRGSFNDEAQKWLLAGGGEFGTVAYNAFETPSEDLAFVLRKEGIGFRTVIDPQWWGRP